MKKNKKEKLISSVFSVLMIMLIILDICLCALYYRTEMKNKKLHINLSKTQSLKDEFETKYNEDHKKLIEIEEKNKKKEVKNPAVKIPIITFHRTVSHDVKVKHFKDSEWVNDISVTESELKYLYDNGWKSIDLDEFYCWYNKDCEFEEKTFVMTIDDGDSEAYYIVLPVLEKYGFKATLFSIGSKIPETTQELNEPERRKLGFDIIKKLREEKSLLQVESHTYNFHSELSNGKGVVSSKTKEEILKDFELNEKYGFRYLAYPFGYYDSKFLDVISNYGNIKMAFKFKNGTYATRLDNKYEIARIKINSYMTLNDFKKWFSYAK